MSYDVKKTCMYLAKVQHIDRGNFVIMKLDFVIKCANTMQPICDHLDTPWLLQKDLLRKTRKILYECIDN